MIKMNTMNKLTDSLIKEAFSQIGVNERFFPFFESFAKQTYEEIQHDQPDEKDTPYEESNAAWCLQHSCEYIKPFVREIEKGHGENWADAYARISFDKNIKDFTTYNTWISIQDPEEKERELEVHANSLSKDPVFKEVYKKMVVELFENAEEKARIYTEAYHRCINNGESESFAKAYTYALVFLEYNYHICDIYAHAYEKAVMNGMDEPEATHFANFCIDAADHGLFAMAHDFSKKFKKDWQKEFYLKLVFSDIEEREKRQLSDKEKESIRNDIFK